MVQKDLLLFGLLLTADTNYLYGFTLHVIGDSHAYFNFTNTLSTHPQKHEVSSFVYSEDNSHLTVPCIIHCFIGRTMFRVGRDGLAGLDITQFNVKEDDVAIFVFGEVDTRLHIGKQRDEKDRNTEEIIDSLVTAYIHTLAGNKNRFARLRCAVISVLPPSNNASNPGAPMHGLLNDRVAITQQVNNALQKQCQLHGIDFLDIYEMFAQKDGSLNMALSDGIVHVLPQYNYMIKNKLLAHLLQT